MTSSATRIAIQSVLVAFDDATFGHEAIEAAVSLAADLEAELQGLYIEDDTLLQIAGLPFVHEITTSSGTVRPMDLHSMQRAMQNKAALVRQMLEHWAASAKIRCSFAVARGRAVPQMLLFRNDSDVIFLSCRRHAPSVRRPMGLRVKSVVRPLLLLIDPSPHGAQALTAAAVVARNHSRPIVLLVLARGPEEFRQLSEAASQTLCELELAHTLLPHPITTTSALIQSARDQRPDLLLLSRECTLVSEATVESMLDQLDCSIVLI